MSFYRRKRDGNHTAIARELRKVTIVTDVHALGAIGFDLLARHVVTKAPVFIEVKDPVQAPSSHDRSENERRMAADYPDHWRKVMTVDDALAAVGVRQWAPPELDAALSALAKRAKRRG